MTFATPKEIRIPVWLFTILVPLIIMIAGYFMTNAKLSATYGTKLENTEKAIIKLENGKADKDVYDMLKTQLDRIETKLDKHLEDHIQQKPVTYAKQ